MLCMTTVACFADRCAAEMRRIILALIQQIVLPSLQSPDCSRVLVILFRDYSHSRSQPLPVTGSVSSRSVTGTCRPLPTTFMVFEKGYMITGYEHSGQRCTLKVANFSAKTCGKILLRT